MRGNRTIRVSGGICRILRENKIVGVLEKLSKLESECDYQSLREKGYLCLTGNALLWEGMTFVVLERMRLLEFERECDYFGVSEGLIVVLSEGMRLYCRSLRGNMTTGV